jgi:lipoprotein LenA
MRKSLIIKVILLSLLPIFIQCGDKKEGETTADKQESKSDFVAKVYYARYSVSAYNEPGPAKKGGWVATLNKAEGVKGVAIKKVEEGKNEVEYIQVEIPGASGEAWIASRHLVDSMGVLVGDKVTLYSRPSLMANLSSTATSASVGILVEVLQTETDTDGNQWVEVRGKYGEIWFKGWVVSNSVSTDNELMRDAAFLERSVSTLANEKSTEEQLRMARETLKELSERDDAIGTQAKIHFGY